MPTFDAALPADAPEWASLMVNQFASQLGKFFGGDRGLRNFLGGVKKFSGWGVKKCLGGGKKFLDGRG